MKSAPPIPIPRAGGPLFVRRFIAGKEYSELATQVRPISNSAYSLDLGIEDESL